MYDYLVKELRTGYCEPNLLRKAADAIEERDRYALNLQHEMMAEAESHIALVEQLSKQVEELELHYCPHMIRNVHDMGDDSLCAKHGCEVSALPHWIPVTEKNHPKSDEPVMVVYVGWHDALPHCDCTAYWSGNEGLWRWAETDGKVKVSVTHYMPLPPLPEPPKEEV